MRKFVQILVCLLLAFTVHAQKKAITKKESVTRLHENQTKLTKDDYSVIIEQLFPFLGIETSIWIKPSKVFIYFEKVPEEFKNQLVNKINTYDINVKLLDQSDINRDFKEDYSKVMFVKEREYSIIISIAKKLPYVWHQTTYQFEKRGKLTNKIISEYLGECAYPSCLSDDEPLPPIKRKVDKDIDEVPPIKKKIDE
jgi:hypothetical protein